MEFSRKVLVNLIDSTSFHLYAFFSPEVIGFFDQPLKLLYFRHQDHGWKGGVQNCPVCQRMGPCHRGKEDHIKQAFKRQQIKLPLKANLVYL